MVPRREMHFSLNDCEIVDKKGKSVLHGTKTSYYCYVLVPQKDLSCHLATVSNSDLWHQHINMNDLERFSKKELIPRLPKLQKPLNNVCGPCQLSKQTRSSHKKVDNVTTKQPLELLHMNLMDPTRTESTGGK